MDEAKRQHLKQKLNEVAQNATQIGDPGLTDLVSLIYDILENPALQPEEVGAQLSAAAEAIQAMLPDLSNLLETAEVGETMLGLIAELLSNLGDISN